MHADQVGTAIDGVLRIVTGCLRPTPLDNLPILAGIQPAKLRRETATLSLARRALEPTHLLHQTFTNNKQHRRLKSRHSFVPAARLLLEQADTLGTSAAHWADHHWNAEWKKNPTRLRTFITDAESLPTGVSLPRMAWVQLNRLRTGVGRFCSLMHKWGVAPSPACDCCTDDQTAEHVITDCPIYRAPSGAQGLRDLDEHSIQWLLNKCPDI